MCLIFAQKQLPFTEPLDHLEAFAGEQSVTLGEIEESRKAVGLDIRMSPDLDILSSTGFLQHIYQLCRVKPGSGFLGAPVCSTFVVVNRGTSRRTRLRPCGEERHQSVREGNWIACRTLILCYIAAALQLWWVVEQPVNSFMQELPAWKFFMKQVKTYRYSLNMEDYGGPTKKPTWLYSGRKEIEDLPLYKPLPHQLPKRESKEMVTYYEDSNGVARFAGGKDLKSSQSYPRQFGRALARLRSQYQEEVKRDAKRVIKHNLKQTKSTLDFKASHKWIKWANLQPVLDCMLSP